MLIFSSNKELVRELKDNLSKSLELSDLGDVNYYLGIEVTRNREHKTITLSQKGYLEKILTRFNKRGLNPVSSPIENSLRLEKNKEQATLEDTRLF